MVFKGAIEIPVFLTFLGSDLVGSVSTNLLIYRTCYVILGYNESECALLGNSDNSTIANLEKLVEPEVNIIDTTRNMFDNIIGLIVCMFIGQWSDKFGRKPVLIFTQIGMVISTLIMSIFSYFPNISPWYFLIAGLPSTLSGGFAANLVATLSYVSDSTTSETRGFRMAVIEATFGLGILVGSICSPYLFYATNYASVYAISAGIRVLAILYTIYFVPESLQNIDVDGKTRDIFQVPSLKELFTFKVLTKKRENYNRSIVCLITAIITLSLFAQSTGNKTFLMLRTKFDWTLTKYTWYSTTGTAFFIFGTVLGNFVFLKWLKITESLSIFAGLMSELDGFLVRGLATSSYQIYFAAGIRCLGGLVSPQCRTLMAKLVPADEVAKLFSIIMVIQFICGIGTSAFYTAIYNATVNIDPAIYNFVCAGFCGMDVILILVVMVLQKIANNINYVPLDIQEEQNSNNVIET